MTTDGIAEATEMDGKQGLRLDGRVAVVTGGGRGLGRAIARELAGNRAHVLINDLFRDDDGASAAEAVCEEIVDAGGTAAANLDDVSTYDGAGRIVESAVAEFGRVDLLVTCAGNFRRSNILDVDEDEWESVTTVHLDGHLACLHAASRQMVKQGGGGRIVTVSSRGGLFGTQVAYSGAKAGIMGLTAGASRELADHGITVNCLLPSAETQLFSIPASARRFGGMPETLRMEPDLVAPLVAYLCAPAASGITGRFLYAGGTDICTYPSPLTFEQATTFARNTDRWTVEGLAGYLPAVLGVEER